MPIWHDAGLAVGLGPVEENLGFGWLDEWW